MSHISNFSSLALFKSVTMSLHIIACVQGRSIDFTVFQEAMAREATLATFPFSSFLLRKTKNAAYGYEAVCQQQHLQCISSQYCRAFQIRRRLVL